MFHLTRLNCVLKFLPARNSHERVSRTKKNFLIEFSRACLTSKSNPCSFQPARCENIQFDIDDFQLQLLTMNFSSFFFILFKLRVNHNKSVWFRHKKKKIFSHSHNFLHRRSWIEWIPSYVSLFGLVGDNVLILFHRRVNFTANIEPRGCLVDIFMVYLFIWFFAVNQYEKQNLTRRSLFMICKYLKMMYLWPLRGN